MNCLIVRPTAQTSAMVRTKEAALYLGISVKKLRRLITLGEIPVIQQGNVWLFRVSDLDRYVASLTATEYPTPSCNKHFGEREVQ
jgi:excisionase family DNA binding protein